MASAFAYGMSHRKGKIPSPKRENSADNGDDDKLNGKILFRRSRCRGKEAIALFIGIFLFLAALFSVCLPFSVLSMTRAKNPGWGEHPRVTSFWIELDTSSTTTRMARAPERSRHPKMVEPMAEYSFLKHLADTRSYENGRADQFVTRTCKAQYDWQLHSFPTCNLLHEREMESLMVRPERKKEPLEMVAHGYWRDVWILPSSNFDGKHVLKTIRYEHDYEERNYDRHRRDALAMERLSGHPYILNLYAFCGNSGVSEYASGGDIANALWPRNHKTGRRQVSSLTNLERLQIGVQAAMGLAAVHNCDKEGRPSIAHTDISPGQFVRVGNIFKLNDFNRARFLRTNVSDGAICGFNVGSNPGKNRSPEEYLYLPETEKARSNVDVYSLGNIFYMLLMDQWPFRGVPEKKAIKRIKNGKRPVLYIDIWNSTDPPVVALRNAMFMCHEQDPSMRASSREIETYLMEELEKIDPGRLDTWPNAPRLAQDGV